MPESFPVTWIIGVILLGIGLMFAFPKAVDRSFEAASQSFDPAGFAQSEADKLSKASNKMLEAKTKAELRIIQRIIGESILVDSFSTSGKNFLAIGWHKERGTNLVLKGVQGQDGFIEGVELTPDEAGKVSLTGEVATLFNWYGKPIKISKDGGTTWQGLNMPSRS